MRRFGLGAVAALGLIATAGTMAPAQAHDYRYGPYGYGQSWNQHQAYPYGRRAYSDDHRGYSYSHRDYVRDHQRDRGGPAVFRAFGHLFRG